MKEDTKEYQKIILGGASTPLPVWDPQTGATGALAGPNSGIALHTTRQDKNGISIAESIYADLMRNLPSRSMLPHLIHELTERDPGRVDWAKHSFLCGYIGPPSIGKSYMLKTLGRLTHPRGVLYLNCKDMDMGMIFCETVFDTSAANREKASIDAKILQGNQGGKGLSADSQSMLKNALGDAYSEEQRGDKTLISIDWNGIQVKGDTPEEQNYQKQVVREAISQVCHNEGIVLQSDMGQIGITTRDGIAIRAADPKSADYGRPVLLDEINRAKPGTLQKLYEFFAMLSDPKVESFQVIGGENRPFTFQRNELPVSYRMNFTGNPSTRGMGSADMDRPLISRFGAELDIRTVPDPALHDYADRISQSLTGVPLTQIYYSAKPFFDENPEQLAETAKMFRLRGLTEAQKRNVPEEELLNISQAARTIQLSEQLATFFSSLKHVFDPESQLFRGGRLSPSAEYESYLQGVEIDLRLVTKLLEKASVVGPKVMSPHAVDYKAAFNGAAAPHKVTFDDRLADRGQRLEKYLLLWLHQVLVPADLQTRKIRPEECQKVLNLAKTIAAHCGIGELPLKESLRGGIERISALYDVDRLTDPQQQAKLLRDQMVSVLRQSHGELPADPDKIISVAEVERAVKLTQDTGASNVPAIFAVNDDAERFGRRPFVAATVTDDESPGDRLVLRDAFLTALSVPELRAKTVEGLWNKAMLEDSGLDPSDAAVQIAANVSDTGFAVTTVVTEQDGAEQPLHILRAAANDNAGEMVIVVANNIGKDTKALLKSGGVTLIDHHDIDAAGRINALVQERLNNNPVQDNIRKSLSAAFLMRNGAPGTEHRLAEKSVGELMTSPQSAPATAPQRITARPARTKP